MGRVIVFIVMLLAVAFEGYGTDELLSREGEAISPEFVTVRNLALSMKLFAEDHPNKPIEGTSVLSNYFNPAALDHKYAWLPLATRYAFLKPNSGSIPGPDGGQVLVICTVPLSRFDLEESTDTDPIRNPPGRYIIWKTSSGDFYHRWFKESEIKTFVRPDVLASITLPKPTVSPRERSNDKEAATVNIPAQSAPVPTSDGSMLLTTSPAQPPTVAVERSEQMWPWVIAVLVLGASAAFAWRRRAY